MRLAWRNLLHDRTRLLVTIVGIAFAVFLMIFEGSLLSGFLKASSEVIDAADADLWITARGVPCFDFPAPLPERFRDLALGTSGVAEVHRIATRFADWQRPDGVRQTAIVIGADPGVGDRFPRPGGDPSGGADLPDTVLVDRSDLDALGVAVLPAEVELGRLRARVPRAVTGFGSFLGSPYVFTTHADAKRFANLGPEETTFLLVRVVPGRQVQEVRQALRSRLPDADVWTRAEFSSRSRTYWVMQTGAGGAILTAGLLGFIVGMVIVSQTIYATTMENLEEFATLKAMGALRRYILRLVLLQSLASGLVGYLAGLAASLPALAALRGAIPWVHTPWWLPSGMLGVSLLMCSIASVVSIRKALAVEPGRVFRA